MVQAVLEAVAAGGFGGGFGARINELSLHFLRFEEADGVVHFGLLAFAALGLEFPELAEGFLH